MIPPSEPSPTPSASISSKDPVAKAPKSNEQVRCISTPESTMTRESPPSCITMTPASNNKTAIKELTENDVLLGRGPGLTKFEGNLRFRKLIDEREQYYKATRNRSEKANIANQVLQIVHDRGGRFLKQDGTIDYNADWYEVSDDVSLEKAKQSLRELRAEPIEKKPDENISSTSLLRAINARLSDDSTSRNDETSCGTSDVSSESVQTSKPASLYMPQMTSQDAVPVSSTSSEVNRVSPLATNSEMATTLDGGSSINVSTQNTFPQSPPVAPPANLPATIPTLAQSNNAPSADVVDPSRLLFQCFPLLFQQQTTALQQIGVNPLLSSLLAGQAMQAQSALSARATNLGLVSVAQQPHLENHSSTHSMMRDFAPLQTHYNDGGGDAMLGNHTNKRASDAGQKSAPQTGAQVDTEKDATMSTLSEANHVDKSITQLLQEEAASANESEEEEVAAFLLSSLSVVDRPVMTEEQEAKELATLTEQEKMVILADALGDMCAVSPQQSKKARRDLDEESIAFLVRQMILEIDKIPPKKKAALTEAIGKTQPEEFCFQRLEKFLRVEGMNGKLAAQRFVKYWEGRRLVFGPEKYVMKMTLSEALKDDQVALDTCVYTLLPPDASGRTVLYMEPHRHTRQGYTSESMLRAIWYVSEVVAAENTDVSGGIVLVNWFNNAGLFDYDLVVFDRWAYFLSSCWPIKLLANHLCCPTSVVNRIVKPIIHTFVSKEWRARTITHNVPVKDIVGVLAKYGISKEGLPQEMGGSLQNHQAEWIANRRAVELEETSFE